MEILLVVVVLVVLYLVFRSRSKSKNTEGLPQEFVVVDIETTGLSVRNSEIIEIAAIRINKDSKNHAVFESLVKPKKGVPPKITNLTGITESDLQKEGRELEPVLTEFIEFIGNSRLVAYNAKFDLGFINSAASQLGLSVKNPVSCAFEMAKRAWPGLKSYKLTELAKLGGASPEGAHRALKDAELTVTVYATAVSILGTVE